MKMRRRSVLVFVFATFSIFFIFFVWKDDLVFSEATQPRRFYQENGRTWEINKLLRLYTFWFYLFSWLVYPPRMGTSSSFQGFIMTTALSSLLLHPLGTCLRFLMKCFVKRSEETKALMKPKTHKKQRWNILMVLGFFSFFVARTFVYVSDKCIKCLCKKHETSSRNYFHLASRDLKVVCIAQKILQSTYVWVFIGLLAMYLTETRAVHRNVARLFPSAKSGGEKKLGRHLKDQIKYRHAVFGFVTIILSFLCVIESKLLEKTTLITTDENGDEVEKNYAMFESKIYSFLFMFWRDAGVFIFDNLHFFAANMGVLFIVMRYIQPFLIRRNCRLVHFFVNIYVRLNQGLLSYIFVLNMNRVSQLLICYSVMEECERMENIFLFRWSKKFPDSTFFFTGTDEEMKKDFVRVSYEHFFLEDENKKKMIKDLSRRYDDNNNNNINTVHGYYEEEDEGEVEVKEEDEMRRIEDEESYNKLKEITRTNIELTYRYEPFVALSNEMYKMTQRIYFIVFATFLHRLGGLFTIFWDISSENGDSHHQQEHSLVRIVVRHFFYFMLFGFLVINLNRCSRNFCRIMKSALRRIRRRVLDDGVYGNPENEKADRRLKHLTSLVEDHLSTKGVVMMGFKMDGNWAPYIYLILTQFGYSIMKIFNNVFLKIGGE